MSQVFAQEDVEASIDHLGVLVTDEDNTVETVENCTRLLDGEPPIVAAWGVWLVSIRLADGKVYTPLGKYGVSKP